MSQEQDIEQLANTARNSISDFCVNDCKAFCCRKRVLLITPEETELLAHEHKDALIDQGSLVETDTGDFALEFNNSLGGCPRLKGTLCSIHTHPQRPATCHKYPIFIESNKVRLDSRCLAVQEGKLFVFDKQARNLGFLVE